MIPGATPAALAVALARTLPIGWLAPPLGGASRSVRGLLGVGLGLLALPLVGALPPVPLSLVLLHELMIGLALGLVSAVPFRAAQAAGALVDHVRRPASDDGVFGRVYFWLSLAVFAALGGPSLWLQALGRSYVLLPIGHDLGGQAAGVAVEAFARLLSLGVVLAAPVLAAALAADLLLGLVARSAPGLQGVGLRILREPILLAAVASLAGLTIFWLRGGLSDIGEEVRNAARLLGNP